MDNIYDAVKVARNMSSIIQILLTCIAVLIAEPVICILS